MANHTPCGIELPQVFFDGPVEMEHIRNFAIKAETLGYDSLWLQERVIGDFNMLEPVTLLSYVAAITTKLRLGTSVILLPLRNPVQLAKAYSTLDVMSGGRAVMGVGLGGGHLGSHEDVFGYTREGRVTRFTEAVQIMKLLWTEQKASFHGRYWNFKDISMEPKPMQKPHLPVIFGGHHENALHRAVKYANGWMGAGSSSSDRSFASRRASGVFSMKRSAIRRLFISPSGFTSPLTTTKRAASGVSKNGSASAIKTPISARKFRSGAAAPSAPKKFKSWCARVRSRSFSIRCSTRWSIWKSAPRKSCRICDG